MTAAAVDAADLDPVGGKETRAPVPAGDAVPFELGTHGRLVRVYDLFQPGHQADDLEILAHLHREDVAAAPAEADQRHRGLAQGLRRDGAATDAGAADVEFAFDQQYASASLSRGHRRAVTGWAAAKHDDVERAALVSVVWRSHARALPTPESQGLR